MTQPASTQHQRHYIKQDAAQARAFITDMRTGTRFTEIRREIFGDNFPASALITVAGLAHPGLLVEVQGIAVID